MNKILFLLITLSFFSVCEAARPQDDLLEQITTSYSEELLTNYKLHLFGSGGSNYFEINTVFLNYSGDKKFGVKDSRDLFINCKEGLVKKINECKEIRPYLHQYPITHERVELVLGFHKESELFAKKPFIAFVSETKNKIYYSCYNPTTELLETTTEEPYDKALKVVQRGKA